MWLAYASLVALCIVGPEVFSLFFRILITLFAYISTSIMFNNFQRYYAQYKEIFHQISYETMIKYIIFRLRNMVTHIFENGKFESRKDVIYVTYFNGDIKYKLCIPKKRCIRQICNVCITGTDIDITERIFEFLGPTHNFHGIPVTPKMLGYDSITVTYRNDDTIVFNENDDILLSSY